MKEERMQVWFMKKEEQEEELIKEKQKGADPGAAKKEHRREADVAEEFPWRQLRRRTTAAKSCSAAAPLPEDVDRNPSYPPPWRQADGNPLPPAPKQEAPTPPPPPQADDVDPTPPPPPQAVPVRRHNFRNQNSAGRRSTWKTCEHRRNCSNYREENECFLCAVHCQDRACIVHWERPGCCQFKGCYLPAPKKKPCRARMCRLHCPDHAECESHKEPKVPGHNRTPGLRAQASRIEKGGKGKGW